MQNFQSSNAEEIKTLEFSQLSIEEKDKFLEFLVENNVEFSEDDEGNHIATIKIINQNAEKENVKEGLRKPIYNYNTTERTLYNETKFSSPKKRTHGGKKISPRIYNKKTASFLNKQNHIYDQNIRELEEFNSHIKKNAPKDSIKSYHKPTSNHSPFQKASAARKSNNHNHNVNSNQHKMMQNYTEYDKLNKPFIPQTRPIVENLEEYSSFFKLLKVGQGVRAKKLNLNTLLKLIEDIYSRRFVEDTAYFKSSVGGEENGETQTLDIPSSSFPSFVFSYLTNKYKHAKLIHQNGVDLISSIDHYRKEHLELELFHKFICELYDSRDLIFYLYVRSLIERELDLKFNSLSSSKRKLIYFSGGQYLACGNRNVSPNCDVDTRNVFINFKVAVKISKIFFEENERILSEFLQKVEQNLILIPSAKEKQISAIHFLTLILNEFNLNRQNSRSETDSFSAFESEKQGSKPGKEDYYAKFVSGGGNPKENALKMQEEEYYSYVENEKKQINTKDQEERPKNTYTYEEFKKQSSEEKSENTSEAFEKIYSEFETHIITKRVDGMIERMLKEHLNLGEDIKELIKEEVKPLLIEKISSLLEALIATDKNKWFALLRLQSAPSQQQILYVENIQKNILQLINQHQQFNTPISNQQIQFISTLILKTPELKHELGMLIAALAMKAQNIQNPTEEEDGEEGDEESQHYPQYKLNYQKE